MKVYFLKKLISFHENKLFSRKYVVCSFKLGFVSYTAMYYGHIK